MAYIKTQSLSHKKNAKERAHWMLVHCSMGKNSSIGRPSKHIGSKPIRILKIIAQLPRLSLKYYK